MGGCSVAGAGAVVLRGGPNGAPPECRTFGYSFFLSDSAESTPTWLSRF